MNNQIDYISDSVLDQACGGTCETSKALAALYNSFAVIHAALGNQDKAVFYGGAAYGATQGGNCPK